MKKVKTSTRQVGKKEDNCNFGFTLFELIVVLGMLAALFTAIIIAINPATQIAKANDARREHDLGQVKEALDAYYNDYRCYPTTLAFGGSLVGKTTYLQKVPQDPDCINGVGICYQYEIDTTSTCPQWDVLYAGLRNQSTVPQNACGLTKIPSCLPINFYSSSYNYCAISGDLNCSYISANPVPKNTVTVGVTNGGGSGGSGGGSGGGPGISPSPTPARCPGNYYACTGSPARCNVETSGQCFVNGGVNACFCNLQSCIAFCGQ